MSMYLQPVVEQWGESVTYSSRTDIVDVLVILARHAQSGQVDRRLYDDLRVVYIEQGPAFLDDLCATDVNTMLASIADAGLLNVDAEGRDRTIRDLKDLKVMSAVWRASIDADDGSLRFYCD